MREVSPCVVLTVCTCHPGSMDRRRGESFLGSPCEARESLERHCEGDHREVRELSQEPLERHPEKKVWVLFKEVSCICDVTVYSSGFFSPHVKRPFCWTSARPGALLPPIRDPPGTDPTPLKLYMNEAGLSAPLSRKNSLAGSRGGLTGMSGSKGGSKITKR